MSKKGHAHSSKHFTGKRGSGSKRKRKSSRKERKKKRRTHKNKYEALAPEKKDEGRGTKFRRLPLEGESGEVMKAGLVYLWHDRRYRLLEDVTIPSSRKCFGRFEQEK
jgi:hypothetical protein